MLVSTPIVARSSRRDPPVADAVLDDEFLLDCMSRELELIERKVPRRESVPFFTTPDTGITFAFRYWAPGSNAGAHEHTAWTITAVCRNKLSVRTFDSESSYRNQALVPKNVFDAPAGRTGFIYEPCIHDPRNPTGRWSMSLHVTSPRDGEQHPGMTTCAFRHSNAQGLLADRVLEMSATG